jgi:hypothetical protein
MVTLFSIIYLSLIQRTRSFLTKHEGEELYAKIQHLQMKNEECNNKYNNLIAHLLKNNIRFNASEFLTTRPYFQD